MDKSGKKKFGADSIVVGFALFSMFFGAGNVIFPPYLGFGAGMGLPNIKTYSDRLKIDTEVGVGTTLTIEIDFD